MNIKDVKFNKDGLVPVITQDVNSGVVLMQAYMNAEALKQTLETGRATYFSRSRNELWVKGATSGNFQEVIEIYTDCDSDCILLKVKQIGNACHTGEYSCFFNVLKKDENEICNAEILYNLEKLVANRRENPIAGSYTNYLIDKGVEKISKKVGEEACEIIIAAMKRDKNEFVSETADFLYHLMVLLNDQNVGLNEIFTELKKRR